jgi:hypothetical protein
LRHNNFCALGCAFWLLGFDRRDDEIVQPDIIDEGLHPAPPCRFVILVKPRRATLPCLAVSGLELGRVAREVREVDDDGLVLVELRAMNAPVPRPLVAEITHHGGAGPMAAMVEDAMQVHDHNAVGAIVERVNIDAEFRHEFALLPAPEQARDQEIEFDHARIARAIASDPT